MSMISLEMTFNSFLAMTMIFNERILIIELNLLEELAILFVKKG